MCYAGINPYGQPIHAPGKKVMALIAKYNHEKLLHATWCSTCAKQTTIVGFTGQVQDGDLVLTGKCEQCGSKVARGIESK